MSNKVTRASGTLEVKEKAGTESPVKEMKKKAAANAEREKAAAEKAIVEKSPSKAPAQTEKLKDIPLPKEKGKDNAQAGKSDEKQQSDKQSEKEQNGKPEEKQKEKKRNADAKTAEPVRNGVTDVALNKNGVTPEPNSLNGNSVSVSPDPDEDVMTVENDNDELFPELSYDDASDSENFEPSTPDNRSMTRRSQVKSVRTPETPRPPSQKQADKETVNGDGKKPEDNKGKETILLKLKEDVLTGARQLRSADRHTPDPNKAPEQAKEIDTSTRDKSQEKNKKSENLDIVTIELDAEENEGNEEKRSKNESRASTKTDTNFSKSRIKISPYRRSTRLADQSSMLANYTGNNTTMEMDFSESSFAERPSTSQDPSLLNDQNASYVEELRTIRGRRSYKTLKDMALRNIGSGRPVKDPLKSLSTHSDTVIRPTVHVLGRKRKPNNDGPSDNDTEADNTTGDQAEGVLARTELNTEGAKRMRLLGSVTSSFWRRSVASSTPLLARRTAPIVGINTDLPMHAPVEVAQLDKFDPESLKSVPAAPLETAAEATESSRQRCLIM